MIKQKKIYPILGLLILATIINGLLAGGNVDRSLVAMPAWQQTGIVAWANFSRHADLGSGQLLYPVMAIGGTLLTVIVSILLPLVGIRSKSLLFPFVLAALCMLVSLPLSFKATPYMLSLRHITNTNHYALKQAFMGFAYWGRLQGLLHVAAFCFNIGSLIISGKIITKTSPRQ